MGITKDNKVLQRLREPSTMAGLGALALLFGLPPDTINVVLQAVGAILGVLAVVLPEKGGN
ncbi:hypothetical protein [Dechloromonas sp. A34]|uniref:hypothetical protein n=1 Tax=Dechloromonas sp. A34 TaxID=447588 RepID=UPI0022496B7F|nr:hypothetical protein [Dechloromonas sp. A34]